MGAFEDRAQAAEAVFAHGLQAQFESRMAGVRRLAGWSVERRGLVGDIAARHTERIVDLALKIADDASLIKCVVNDLELTGIHGHVEDAAKVMNVGADVLPLVRRVG